MDHEPNWNNGLKWGLRILLMAVISEGGIVIILFYLAFKFDIWTYLSMAGITLALFTFGFIHGAYKDV